MVLPARQIFTHSYNFLASSKTPAKKAHRNQDRKRKKERIKYKD